MSKRARKMLAVFGLATVSAWFAMAGDMEPPSGPLAGASQMYTLEDIYNRLSDNTTATKASEFTGPVAGPGSTGHNLDDIYAKAIPTQVPKTGQTTSYATGDDGDLEKGVAWPNPRFTDNGDGTVTDNLTGLIWTKNADIWGAVNWAAALSNCNSLANGTGGLTDGSSAGDWRLPNVKELQSLTDFGNFNPALPSGHPFVNVQNAYYWSGSTFAFGSGYAWTVALDNGDLNGSGKTDPNYVWPVRGGQ